MSKKETSNQCETYYFHFYFNKTGNKLICTGYQTDPTILCIDVNTNLKLWKMLLPFGNSFCWNSFNYQSDILTHTCTNHSGNKRTMFIDSEGKL